MPYPGTKLGDRAGTTFMCEVCGAQFYRLPSQILNGSTRTCSKKCLSSLFMGQGNPFWGHAHTDETKSAISANRRAKAIGNQNARGFHHSEETKKAISEASKKQWREHRQKMLDSLPRGEAHIWHKPAELLRYRREWTPRQRREWKAAHCAWCTSTDNLVLDHIVPIFMKGGRYQENCQTLCQRCNLWKLWFIERPMWLSLQTPQATN